MSSISDLLVQAIVTGAGVSIGNYFSTRYVLTHLDKINSKKEKK